MTSSPRVRVMAGVIVRDGRVVAARRGDHQSLAGLWEFPGGKVEPGETDAEALRRELREELDVDVAVDEHLGSNCWERDGRSFVLVVHAVRLLSGEPRAIEHTEVRWVHPDAFDTIDWSPADRFVLPFVAAYAIGKTEG